MLPKLDGLSVCKRIKNQYNVPIIMITAKDGEIDKILGLELGADDYITKPFSVRELVARVKANLRKVDAVANLQIQETEDKKKENKIVVGELELDMIRNPSGIFQFEGAFAFDCLKKFVPKSIFDMSIVTACIRPSGASYRDVLLARQIHKNPSELIDEIGRAHV